MRYFPLFYDLKNRKAIVVGGGEEALRKIRLLLKTEVEIHVIAAELHPELAANARVNWLAKKYAAKLLDGAAVVFSSDKDLNPRVSKDAQSRGIPINAVDQAEISTFIVPSIVDRDPVVVAIGSEGTAPVLAQNLRGKIDALLPQNLGALATRAAGLREWVGTIVSAGAARRAFWADFFFGAPQEALRDSDEVAFRLAVGDAAYIHSKTRIGRVAFVVASSPDPELLTIKAHRRMMEADVIVHDQNISRAILEMARRDAVRIAVDPQARNTCEILTKNAKAGLNVVRLTSQHLKNQMLKVQAQSIAVETIGTFAVEPTRKSEKLSFPLREDIRDAIMRAAS
jgi:uroporphyrin-III C-methyltransferase / precorrin-2 dehydrogenase / sirohydrochlorin ferrochelatase